MTVATDIRDWPASDLKSSKKDSKQIVKDGVDNEIQDKGRMKAEDKDISENSENGPKLSDEERELLYSPSELEMDWKWVPPFVIQHIVSVYAVYLLLTGEVMWQTMIWHVLCHICAMLGMTAGLHRLWSHRSYTATRPLQYFLVLCQSLSAQLTIHEVSRFHRIHHKWPETNADKTNAKRGFFFAHIGWRMTKEHPAVLVKQKLIDYSDLESDWLIMFQKNYYIPLSFVVAFVYPTVVPWYFWGQDFWVAFCMSTFRTCYSMHCVFLINSAGHLWGRRPYDKRQGAVDHSIFSWFSFGDGDHNYHHVYAWDYKTSEFGMYSYNYAAAFIDLMAKLGLASNLKTVPENVAKNRALRTGDGTRGHNDFHDLKFHGGAWGWGDGEMGKEFKEVTETLYPIKNAVN